MSEIIKSHGNNQPSNEISQESAYPEAGMLMPAPHQSENRREILYDSKDIELAQQIRKMEVPGYSLEEIKTLMNEESLETTANSIDENQLLNLKQLAKLTQLDYNQIRRLRSRGLIKPINDKKPLFNPETIDDIELIKKIKPLTRTLEEVKLILENKPLKDTLLSGQKFFSFEQAIEAAESSRSFLGSTCHKYELIDYLQITPKRRCYSQKSVERLRMLDCMHNQGVPIPVIIKLTRGGSVEEKFNQLQNKDKIISKDKLSKLSRLGYKYLDLLVEKGILQPVDEEYLSQHYFESNLELLKAIKSFYLRGFDLDQIAQMIEDQALKTHPEEDKLESSTTQELAELTGISSSSLESYKSLNIITPLPSYSVYVRFETQSTLERLNNIRILVSKGIDLKSIKTILNQHPDLINRIISGEILNVKDVALKTNLDAPTIRVYTNQGLISLHEDMNWGGFWYDKTVVDKIKSIHALIEAGYTHQEIKSALGHQGVLNLLEKGQIISIQKLTKKTKVPLYYIIKWANQRLIRVIYKNQDVIWFYHDVIEQIEFIKECLNQGITDPNWVRSQIKKSALYKSAR